MLIHDSLGTGAFSHSSALYSSLTCSRTLTGPLSPVSGTLRRAYPLWYRNEENTGVPLYLPDRTDPSGRGLPAADRSALFR